MKDKTRKNFLLIFCGLMLAVIFPLQLQAQLTRGAISGTVKDASGAVVPGANVKVTAVDTNVSRDATTDENGFYRIGALDPGVYVVRIEKTGFTAAENREFQVNTATESTFDVDLKVGSVTESIDITAQSEAITLNKTNATVGTIIDSRRAEELPLGAARNVNNLALLSPNVFSAPGSTGISANGQRARNNNFTIDGSDNNDITVTLSTVPVVAEAVQEFQIQTNPYSAEYGRNTGAAINITTKSGTNNLHGSFWNYYRGSDLNAMTNVEKRNPLLTGPAQFVRNQTGLSIGGPVRFPNFGDGGPQIYDGKDRTFFFFTVQRDKNSTGTLQGGAVRIPTPAGFAALSTVPLRPGGQPLASRAAVLNQLSFLNGIYAQNPSFTSLANSCINPNVTNPPPGTCPGGVFIQTGLTNVGIKQPFLEWNYTFRFDHKISDSDSLTARILYVEGDSSNVTSNLNFGELFSADQLLKDTNVAISESHVFSANMINEFRFSYIRRNLDFPEKDPQSSTTTIGGLFTFGGLSNFPQSRVTDYFQFSDTMTYTTGNHTFKFGGDIRYNILDNFSGFDFKGTFNFSSLQNYLNNNAASFAQANSAAIFDAKQLQQAYFFQDDWRIRPNLTLNLGLRYETANVPFGFFGSEDPVQNAALIPRPVKTDKNNFAPVVGFAWSPNFSSGIGKWLFGENLSSIRGGYRTAYDVLFYNILVVNAGNFPFTTSSLATNVLDVYPNLAPATPPVLNLLNAFVNSPENLKNPESYLYSLSFQRELFRQFVVEIGYSGSRSINQINQGQANPSTLTQLQIDNVIGSRNIGPVNAQGQFRCPLTGNNLVTTPSDCAGSVQTRRLFPQWGARTLIASEAQATYNAGYISVKKRFANNLLFDVAYTFSRLTSNNDESLGVAAITGGSSQVPQDFFNYDSDRSLSAFDRTHRLVVNYVYEIPIPDFIENNAFGKAIFGGFQISGITAYQSGQPFSILTGVDSNGNGTAGSDRPNWVPGGILNLDPVTGNWRTFTSPLVGGAFFTPLTGANNLSGLPLANTQFNGNLGKNTFRTPGFWNSDISVMKRIALPFAGENGHQLQLRADFLNAFNQDNYGRPVNLMNSPDFGRNLNNWGNRSITLSAKYSF